MKKKILFIVLCLCSFLYMGNVKAVVTKEDCTEEKLKGIVANLNYSSHTEVVIPLLNRTDQTGKANLYHMSLNVSGKSNAALCMDNPLHAGTKYKILSKVERDTYKKAYQYAITANDETKYIIAQTAIWLIEDGKLSNNNLEQAVKEIHMSMNCETYFSFAGAMSLKSDLYCNSFRKGNTPYSRVRDEIIQTAQKNGRDLQYTIIPMETKVNDSVKDYLNYSSRYAGDLYIWEAIDSGNRQRMLAPPPDCTPGKPTTPTTPTVPSTPGEQKYTIEIEGRDATCSDSSTNVGWHHENIVTADEGTAIPEIGDVSKTINQYCNLYCWETSAQQIFPGNVRPAVSVGTYVIWPTSEATLASSYKNRYPLKFTGKKECTVVMTPNTVNGTNLQDTYNSLKNNINSSNQYDRVYAKQYYESSRSGNDCNSKYDAVCAPYIDATNKAYTKWQNHINSTEYKEAVRKKNEYEQHNKSVNECNAANAAKSTECGNRKNTCIAGCGKKTACIAGCNAEYNACMNSQTSCGNMKSLTSEEQRLLDDAIKYENEYNRQKTLSDNCQTQKNLCNQYASYVKQMVDFGNQLKTCANYTPICAGTSCEIYNYKTNVDLSWGDPEYGTTIPDSMLEKTQNYSMDTARTIQINTTIDISESSPTIMNKTNDVLTIAKGFPNKTNNYNKQNAKVFTANVDVTYSLPTTNLLFNYVVKRNDSYKSQTEKPSGDSNYTTVGFSNLPVSYNARVGQLYELRLSNIVFGDNGQYTPSTYICNYEPTKTPTSNCLCPPGTKNEGQDLSSIMIDKNVTCYTAQQMYCDNDKPSCPDGSPNGPMTEEMTSCMEKYDYFTCYDMNCRIDDKSKYCPEPNQNIELTTCLNNYSYDYCYSLLCDASKNPGVNPDNPSPTGGYKCKNTNGADGPMDITSCVYTKMAQGLNVYQAIDECDRLICPLSGLRIIYRTISLENPFPSKRADAVVTQPNLNVGMFNDDVKGRYPGTNWNDVELVKKHILTVNRQGNLYDGSAIYQEAEPLYTFVLTTDTINNIRNYNNQRVENGGYADFTLDCKINHAVACVSDFVHDPNYGLVGGTCLNATSRNNFYTCSGD